MPPWLLTITISLALPVEPMSGPDVLTLAARPGCSPGGGVGFRHPGWRACRLVILAGYLPNFQLEDFAHPFGVADLRLTAFHTGLGLGIAGLVDSRSAAGSIASTLSPGLNSSSMITATRCRCQYANEFAHDLLTKPSPLCGAKQHSWSWFRAAPPAGGAGGFENR